MSMYFLLIHTTKGNYFMNKKNKRFKEILVGSTATAVIVVSLAPMASAATDVNKDSQYYDAGDVFSGTLYFNEFKGQSDMEFMNIMGYDVMTLGNHEFDLGSDTEGNKALADFIKAAKFPFVSSNVDF